MRTSPLRWAAPIVLVSSGVVMGVTSPTVATEARQPAPHFAYGPVTYPGSLYGVSAVSTSDVWAVGSDTDNDNNGTALIEHWDGAHWSQVATPHFKANTGSWLYGVDALSAKNAWAVGKFNTTGTEFDTLILHWDGAAWTQVASPNPGGALGSYLYSVSAVSANDVWAVGWYYASPLILHWDGTAWTQVDAPGHSDFYLNSVSAVNSTSAYAVGNTFGGLDRAVIISWNGTQWKKVDVGSAKRGQSTDLNGVSATSATDVWAVGSSTVLAHRLPTTPLILHFDGTTWQRMVGETPRKHTELAAVVAVSGDDVWAAGSYNVRHGVVGRTFIEHWNGSSWGQTHTPNPGYYESVNGIDAIGPDSAWAGGTFLNGGQMRSMTLNRIGIRWIQL